MEGEDGWMGGLAAIVNVCYVSVSVLAGRAADTLRGQIQGTPHVERSA